MKVKFVLSPSCHPFNLAYYVGDVVEIEDAVASDLIAQQFAIPEMETAAEAPPKGDDLEKALKAEKPVEKAEKRG